MDKPNLQGRLDTLKVHTRKIRLSDDVDLRKIAQATAGAVGADLANLVNEAALRAVRKGRQLVNQEDLLVSFETVIAGTEKKNTVLTDMEKRLVAYHEVGHALVAALEKHSQPVSKITIVPHTSGALAIPCRCPRKKSICPLLKNCVPSCVLWWADVLPSRWCSASRPPALPTISSGQPRLRETW